MNKYFSIGETAKKIHTTTETLRHYDRIGLVKPSKKDEWTNYRYYTEQDIVRLNTIRALQLMGLPLQEIINVLEYDDLEKIVNFLKNAEKKADDKIQELQYGKSKIQLAIRTYEKQLQKYKMSDTILLKEYPERIIFLSDTLEEPTLDNLWNYLGHFYNLIPSSLKEHFSFEDQAGIYMENGLTRLFAICIHYAKINGLKVLPEGQYLCVRCAEENKEKTLCELIKIAKDTYGTDPKFIVQLVIVSGILQWNYEIQVHIETKNNK